MKNKRGITLIALIITIIILFIIAGVSIVNVSEYLDDVRLKAFYTKLEIAMEGIEKINNTNETYKDKENNIIIIKQQGTSPTQEQISLIESLGHDSTNFKYFTAEQVNRILDISGVDLNLLIDFGSTENENYRECVVINPEGIEIAGQRYYTLEREKYSVKLDKTKNSGNVDFDYTVEKYGTGSYKINVTPINVGNIKDGIVKYKSEYSDYWTVAKDNVIIVSDLASYDIMYTDAKGNTITKTILLSLYGEDCVIATEQ